MNWLAKGFFGLLCKLFSLYCDLNSFTIYWNVPTHLCKNHDFPKLLDELKIVQNKDGNFSGEEFTILYSPGLWPSLEHKKEVNGGMPHRGNLTEHLEILQKNITEKLPNEEYSGLAVIDMESWRPVFRQNTGWMLIYRNLTFEEVISKNKTLEDELAKDTNKTNKALQNYLFQKAAEIFEPKAKEFLMNSTKLVKELREQAKWGYYGFPYCFNFAGSLRNESCPDIVQKENNETGWLFESYNYWYPSVYISHDGFTEDERMQLVRGRTTEYQRLRLKFNSKAEIYPYVWYLYNLSDKYLSKKDLKMTLEKLKEGKMDGAIIWGSSKNLTNETQCEKLYNYVKGDLKSVLLELNILESNNATSPKN